MNLLWKFNLFVGSEYYCIFFECKYYVILEFDKEKDLEPSLLLSFGVRIIQNIERQATVCLLNIKCANASDAS